MTYKSWFAEKRPVLQFLAVFNLVLLAYFLVRPTILVTQWLGPLNLRASAAAAAELLGWLGEDVTRTGVEILSPRGGLRIQRGCDIIGPAVLLVAAIVAFPGKFKPKIPGVLLGVPALFLINLVRILSLYYTQIYFPRAFPTLHVAVWQPGIVLAALLLFMTWCLWALRPVIPVESAT